MPALDVLSRKYNGKTGTKIAYLYQLTFPDDMVYIGCTTIDPFLRLYKHKHNISLSRIGPIKYSDVAYAINKYNEVIIKVLVVGDYKYIHSLEGAAIRILDTTNKGIGYNIAFNYTVLRGRPQKRLT